MRFAATRVTPFPSRRPNSRRLARPATWASTIPSGKCIPPSKHGVRNDLKQHNVLPADAAAPTCQTCHMQDGNHEVRTAWGFLAVRLPLPEDKQWAADRATILASLGRA